MNQLEIKGNREDSVHPQLFDNQVNERWCRTEEVARHFDVKPSTVYFWVQNYRDFPVLKIASNSSRYKLSEVEKWLKTRRGIRNVSKTKKGR